MHYRTEVIGRLGRDAVTSVVDGGSTVINFPLCYSKKYTDKHGQARETEPVWLECSVWKKAGDSTEIKNYLTKGKLVFVEGQVTADVFISVRGDEPKAVLKLKVSNLALL